MPKAQTQRSLYDFLRMRKGEPFTFVELMAGTEYSNEKSVKVLLRGTWMGAIEVYDPSPPKRWRARRGFRRMSFEDFEHAVSHVKSPALEKRVAKARARDLLSRVRPQARAAVELLNRPGFASRAEAFLLLFTNAWELLLKAELVEREGWDAVFKPSAAGKKKRSHQFESLVKGLPSGSDEEAALQAQLTDLYDLRNEAAHLVLSGTSREMLHLFAGSLRSLSQRFESFTGSRLFEVDDMAGFLVLVGLGAGAVSFQALNQQDAFDERIAANIQKFGELYAVPLRVSVRAVDEDVASSVEIGEGQVLMPSPQAVRERFRFKRDEVARRVTEALRNRGQDLRVREHKVDLVRRKESWGTTSENAFVTQFPAAKLYSQEAVERIVELIEERPGYLEIAARQERMRQAKKRKKKSRGAKKP